MHRRVGALSQRVGVLTVTHRAVRQRDGALREGLVMGVVLSMRKGSVFKWQFVGAQWDRFRDAVLTVRGVRGIESPHTGWEVMRV